MIAGEKLPALERAIRLVDMVAYAGATWDWHPLHYDGDWLRARGLDRPVVDGQMLGALMAQQIAAALGPRAFITELSFRLRAMVFAGDVVRIEGEVVEPGHIKQTVFADERIAAEGTAIVRVA
ncbi:MAG: MaoC/PaaZ C-terminal domain-containing protein [Actinomycetota bacterium]